MSYIPGRWTDSELAILHSVYPAEGVEGVRKRLPLRSAGAIEQKAWKEGVTSNPVLIEFEKKQRQRVGVPEEGDCEECRWFRRFNAKKQLCLWPTCFKQVIDRAPNN